MAFSRSSSLLFVDDEPTQPEHSSFSFELIGRTLLYYKWTKECHKDFTDWWLQTEWVLQKVADDENDDMLKLLGWNSTTRTSSYWQSFDQAALATTGEPAIICCRCQSSLSHPAVKNTGTSSLKNHLRTNACRAGNPALNHGRSTGQRSIEDTFRSSSQVISFD